MIRLLYHILLMGLIAAAIGVWYSDHSVRASIFDLPGKGFLYNTFKSSSIFHPSAYHKAEAEALVDAQNISLSAKRPYFEGWYVKVVDDDGRTFAIIPGVFYGSVEAHAFVFTLDNRGIATRTDFPLSKFHASESKFDITIGKNRFTSNGVELFLSEMTGKLEFRGATPWPISFTEPGVMGWFAWLPFMECYHGVPSLTHSVFGNLKLAGGKEAAFSGTPGYIEKDRGQQFPSAWIWMQSNDFRSDDEVSPTASIKIS